MTIGFFPEEEETMVAEAARRAFSGAADPERAIDDLEILAPVGAGVELVAAAAVVREAARAGADYPLSASLVFATVEGRTGSAAEMRAAFGSRLFDGRIAGQGGRLLLPEEGRTLILQTGPGAAPSDPLMGFVWGSAAEADAGSYPVETRPIAWTLLAAAILGAGEAMLEATVAYLSEREQFGRKLGSFQALRHRAASDWVRLEDIRAAVDLAGVAFDSGDTQAALEAARIAKATASEHGPLVAENAIHSHGAMGFTWETGLHRPLVAIRHAAAALGSAAEHYRALGASQIEQNKKEAARHERA